MKRYGIIQRHFYAEIPEVYDRETHVVSFGFEADSMSGNDGEKVEGYSGFQVEIDSQIDYGHIKSQLIEAAYPPKDEFGMAMNAIGWLVKRQMGQAADDNGAAEEFLLFDEWRNLCASAAKAVMEEYK